MRGSWPARFAWIAIVILAVAPIYFLATIAAIRSGIFNLRTEKLTNEELKSILVFLASTIAGSITLIGILATAAHNRRTTELQEEAEKNRLQLAEDEDRRIRLESVVKGLELLTDQDFAKRARVAGAISTIVHLGHTPIALSTLESAWLDGAIDPNSATWLIDQVLLDGRPADVSNAATILFQHAHDLTTLVGGGMVTYLPEALQGHWDPKWPPRAKVTFVGTLVRVLLSQAPTRWKYSSQIFRTLIKATEDEDEIARRTAAAVLGALVRTPDNLSPVFGFGPDARPAAISAFERLRSDGVGPNWFHRTPEMIEEIERWHQGVAEWPHSWREDSSASHS